jgi:hypothetical protein
LDWKERNPQGLTSDFKRYFDNLSSDQKKVCGTFTLQCTFLILKLQFWRDREAAMVSLMQLDVLINVSLNLLATFTEKVGGISQVSQAYKLHSQCPVFGAGSRVEIASNLVIRFNVI